MSRRKIAVWVVCLLVIGGSLEFLLYFPTKVNGTMVSGTQYDGSGGPWTMAGSPYIVVSNITIPAGKNLTIHPGVEVKFDGYYRINIDGNLTAIGTETNRINITSNIKPPASSNWDRIQINSTGHAEIKYSNISFGNLSMYLLSSSNNITNNYISSNNQGIRLYKSSNNNIINNNVSSNNGNGIRLYESSNNNIVAHNTFSSNKINGISVHSSSENNILLNNTIFLNNNYGIFLFWSSNNDIINNFISNNKAGTYLWFSSHNRIFHNNIINNTIQAYDNTGMINYWNDPYPSGGNYWSDYGGSDDFRGPNQNITGGDGIGDTPYVIDFDSQDNYPLMDPYKHIPENSIVLLEGWSLISIPLLQEDQNLTKVFEMIDGDFDSVEWYNISDTNDPWKIYNVDKPFGIDLTKINHKIGFWIHITQPGKTLFVYNGIQPTENQTITLYPGWNLVGYPSLNNKNRTGALNNLAFGPDVDAIWTYNSTTQKWKDITTSDNFEVGRGYWIHSKVTKIWIVPL